MRNSSTIKCLSIRYGSMNKIFVQLFFSLSLCGRRRETFVNSALESRVWLKFFHVHRAVNHLDSKSAEERIQCQWLGKVENALCTVIQPKISSYRSNAWEKREKNMQKWNFPNFSILLLSLEQLFFSLHSSECLNSIHDDVKFSNRIPTAE